MRFFLSVAFAATLIAAVAGQEMPRPQKPAKGEGRDAIEKPKHPGEPLPQHRPYVIKKPAPDTPDEVGKLPGVAAGVIALTAAAKPAELRAGESGTITLILAPAGEAMLLDPPPLQFTFAPLQDGIALPTQPVFRPSTPSPELSKLKGLKAYVDTAIAEVPFTVNEGVEPGVHRVEFKLKYQLLAGPNGGVLGPFTDIVGAEVRVVPAAPAPTAVGARVETPAADPHATPADVAARDDGPVPSAPEAPAVVPGSSYLLLGSGLALLAAVGLLTWRRR